MFRIFIVGSLGIKRIVKPTIIVGRIFRNVVILGITLFVRLIELVRKLVNIQGSVGTTTKKSAGARSSMVVMRDSRLVVLSQNQVQGFLYLQLLQLWCLSDDHLTLLLGDVRLLQQKPSLDLWRDLDAVLFNLAKLLIMVSHKVEQGLTWSAAQVSEVGIKILRQSNTGIVMKCLVKHFQQRLESAIFIDLCEVKILNQTPCSTLKRSNDVQNAFSLSFLKTHFQMVNIDPFPPLLIRTWLAIKQWNKRILGNATIKLTGLCRGHCACSSLPCLLGSTWSSRLSLRWHPLAQRSLYLWFQRSSQSKSPGSWCVVDGVRKVKVEVDGDVKVNGVAQQLLKPKPKGSGSAYQYQLEAKPIGARLTKFSATK